MEMIRNLVLFDIDGCLLEPCPIRMQAFMDKDYAGYHAGAHRDAAIPAGLAVYKALLSAPYLVCRFLTDRSENNRSYTQARLDDLGFGGIPMMMRDKDRKRALVAGGPSKVMTLLEHGYKLEEVLLVFEDRQDIVDHWRALGITVYQTKVADYPV